MDHIKHSQCNHGKLDKVTNGHTFCKDCGILVMVENEEPLFLLKPKEYQQKIDFDPLDLFQAMRISVENSFNVKTTSQWYSNQRKNAIAFLTKLISTNRYSEKTFYTGLFYIDTILRDSCEISETKMDLIVIGCFLLSVKFAEDDPYMPDLTQIPSSNGKFIHNLRDVKRSEEYCVKLLKYKLDWYTSYDILLFLMCCGIVFPDEVLDMQGDYLSKIYRFAKQVLATVMKSSVILEHNSLELAFAVVYLTRGQFKLEKSKRKVFSQVFDMPFRYYCECANKCKAIITEKESTRTSPQILKAYSDEVRKNKPQPSKGSMTIVKTTSKFNTEQNLYQVNDTQKELSIWDIHGKSSELPLFFPKNKHSLNALSGSSKISTATNSLQGSGVKAANLTKTNNLANYISSMKMKSSSELPMNVTYKSSFVESSSSNNTNIFLLKDLQEKEHLELKYKSKKALPKIINQKN